MDKDEIYINRTHVSDKVYAFTLQVKHMLKELLKAEDGDVISLEYLDDVGIQNNDGNELIQVKNTISKSNPTSNKSVAFWKTFYNWLLYVKKDKIEVEKTKFKLFIHTIVDKNVGDICKKFNNANNINDAEQALNIAIEEIQDDGKKEISETYKKYIDALFQEENKNIVINIIKNFTVEIEKEEEYEKTLTKALENKTLENEYTDKILRYLLGWVHEEVEKSTKNGKPSFIKYCDFKKILKSQLIMYRQENILHAISIDTDIDDENIEAEIRREDQYIKQLNLIDIKYEDKISAVKAFLKTSIDKTGWAERGLITSESIKEYQKNLIEMWNNSKNLIEIEKKESDDEKKLGKKLYFICLTKKDVKLQGKELPSHFMKGEYNNLANNLIVGWHLSYKKLLCNKERVDDKNE